MSYDKRRRGRPHGSGKNDEPYLVQVADLLIREPSLKPTTAMKRIMMRSDWLETGETLIRRWQVKWKSIGGSLLAAARERAQLPSDALPTRLTDRTWVPAISNLHGSPINKMMMDIAKDIANSPINKMMRDIADSPINKMMKR